MNGGWDKGEKGTADRERSNEDDLVYRRRNGSSQWILVNTHAMLLLRLVRFEKSSPSKRGIRSTLSLGLADHPRASPFKIAHPPFTPLSPVGGKLYRRNCVWSGDFGAFDPISVTGYTYVFGGNFWKAIELRWKYPIIERQRIPKSLFFDPPKHR